MRSIAHSELSAFDPACVKTHTIAKCRKYSSPTRYRTSCAEHDSPQVGRLLASEDTVDVSRRAAVLVALIGAIGDQAAGLDEVAERIDRGQLVPGRQRSDPIGMVRGESVWRDDQSAVRAIRQCCNVALHLARIVDVDHAQFNADRCERLDRGKLADSGYGGFAQNRDAVDARRDFLEQLEPFGI